MTLAPTDVFWLTLNGQRREYAQETAPSHLAALVVSLGLDPEMVVAEVNGDIVKRADYASHPLTSGDAVELVRFVGGG